MPTATEPTHEQGQDAALLDEWNSMPRELIARVPAPLFGSLNRYMRQQIPTGGFLRAVLENDLFRALNTMNPFNPLALKAVVECLKYAPQNSYGSRETVAAWLAQGQEKGG